MGLSYDSASSILLCAEDNSILCFEDEELQEDGGRGWASDEKQRGGLFGDFMADLPAPSDDCLGLLVKREPEHRPRDDYEHRLLTGSLDLQIRRDAIDWIWKVNAHYNFGPLTAYLSVNYLDRFLSAYELPQGKTWMAQLLSVACLSLAAKMEETDVPLALDLQVEGGKYVFEARTIQRMELIVLTTLKWRMQAVTPFSFIDYFLHKFDSSSSRNKLLVSRAIELTLSTTRGIEFLSFRPSEIAAAAAMSALGETTLMLEIQKALASCNHVDKERVMSCYQVMQEVVLMRSGQVKSGITSSVQSPNGVIDAACLSYKSEDDNIMAVVGSHANSHQSSPATKRRKIMQV